jgi:hypothetical protein
LKTKKNRSAGFENQEKLLHKPAKQIDTVSFLAKTGFFGFRENRPISISFFNPGSPYI